MNFEDCVHKIYTFKLVKKEKKIDNYQSLEQTFNIVLYLKKDLPENPKLYEKVIACLKRKVD